MQDSDTARILAPMGTWRDRAKRRMAEMNIGHGDLLDVFGVKTRGAVSHYFSGRNEPPIASVVALAERLKMSLDELLRGERNLSQSVQTDFGKLGSAVYLLREYLEIVGDPPEWIHDPVLLEIAHGVVDSFGEQVTASNVIDLTKRLGSGIRHAEGKDGDGRANPTRGGTAAGATHQRTA